LVHIRHQKQLVCETFITIILTLVQTPAELKVVIFSSHRIATIRLKTLHRQQLLFSQRGELVELLKEAICLAGDLPI
jgi:hypothetical protein